MNTNLFSARVSALFLLALCISALRADVRMPGIFGDHMVLQQEAKISVWGWADPGEAVTVTLGAQSARTQADANGKWRVNLDKVASTADARTLTVTGKNTLTFTDVLVGDVWVCSGQSNMEYGIFNVNRQEADDPQIRIFHVTKSASLTPLDNTAFVPAEIGVDTLSGHWQTTIRAGSWGGFSAVGLLFAKEIHQCTHKPVGMIGSYWGGTPAQAWTSLTGLEKHPALANYVNGFNNMTPEQKKRFPVVWADYVGAMKKWDKEAREPYDKSMREWQTAAKTAHDAGQPEPAKPVLAYPRPANPGNVGTTTTLFNGMINPLIPFAITGVIWYQGESNAYNGREYGILFPNLIADWREKWGQGDFPFLFVQIANYAVSTADPTRGTWAWLREGQTRGLALPNTAMAVTIDIGDPNNIHPKDKADVAHRLALAARHVAYGQDVVYSGPAYASMKVEGHTIRLSFTQTGSGLTPGVSPIAPPAAPPTALTGFEIAGTNQQWAPAKAVIDGNTILVSADTVPAPVAVRYAWADNPTCNLYNKEGLPASPFRTDDWK